jgi:hypothetical protein
MKIPVCFNDELIYIREFPNDPVELFKVISVLNEDPEVLIHANDRKIKEVQFKINIITE